VARGADIVHYPYLTWTLGSYYRGQDWRRRGPARSGIIFRTNPTAEGQAAGYASRRRANHATTQEIVMAFTAEHLSPIVALIAGVLILILPSLLNYVVAIYLIVIGLIGLNGIYHFIN
jgi:hypothetical protein